MKNLILLILVFCSSPAFAETTWIGPASMDFDAFEDDANWSDGGPTPSERVIFNTAVTIIENVPLTAANGMRIQGSLTISNGISILAADILMDGGTLTNNGKLILNNLTYSNAGGTVTNNGILSARNINVGNSAVAGTFTNNDSLAVLMNIVVEEGTFDNNSGGRITSNGVDVRTGGNFINGGILRSVGLTSSVQVEISNGGSFINESTGYFLIDFGQSNVYALRILGDFLNDGTIEVGHSPFNPDAQGILVGNTGDFTHNGLVIFRIDPDKCVVVDNSGINGSYNNNSTFTIISGDNCLNNLLPIQLTSLNGFPQSGFNTIQWTVENEIELKSYELQRSFHGNPSGLWTSVATLSPEAPDVSYNKYSYRDSTMLPQSYYRLKMLYHDGLFSFSEIIAIKNSSKADMVKLFPVPGRHQLFISGLRQNEIYSLLIINSSGVVLKRINYPVSSGGISPAIEIESLTNGVYHLMIQNEKGWSVDRLKFIKID